MQASGRYPKPKNQRLHYCVAAAEASALSSASVDLITLAHALHWFDLPRFFAEVKRTDPVSDLMFQLERHWADPKAIHIEQWPIAVRVGRKAGFRLEGGQL
jgi:hypothetical protein